MRRGRDGLRVVVGNACGLEVEAELDDFEVPVAEVAPEELVDGAGGFVEAVVGECAVDLGGDGVGEAGENPAGFEGVVEIPPIDDEAAMDGAPGFVVGARLRCRPGGRGRGS